MSKPLTITVWSDYVCPWCYVGLAELESVRARWNFTVDWRPFMLRPDTPEEGWPLPPHIKAMLAAGKDPVGARAKKLGIVIHHRELIPSSRRAHEATEFAREHGKLDAFHHAVLQRYWEKQQDIHEWSVLREAAVEVGLDADAMQREVDAGTWRQAMKAGVQAAEEIGIHAVPTFILDGKLAIQGAQEATTFERALEQLGCEKIAA